MCCFFSVPVGQCRFPWGRTRRSFSATPTTWVSCARLTHFYCLFSFMVHIYLCSTAKEKQHIKLDGFVRRGLHQIITVPTVLLLLKWWCRTVFTHNNLADSWIPTQKFRSPILTTFSRKRFQVTLKFRWTKQIGGGRYECKESTTPRCSWKDHRRKPGRKKLPGVINNGSTPNRVLLNLIFEVRWLFIYYAKMQQTLRALTEIQKLERRKLHTI